MTLDTFVLGTSPSSGGTYSVSCGRKTERSVASIPSAAAVMMAGGGSSVPEHPVR